MVSPSSRQAEMSKKSTSSLRDLTRLTASPNEHKGMPSFVKRNSGSLVRLPARTTRLKLTTSLPPLVCPARLTIQEHSRFSSATALAAFHSAFGYGHLEFLVFDGGYDVAVFVVAEHLTPALWSLSRVSGVGWP